MRLGRTILSVMGPWVLACQEPVDATPDGSSDGGSTSVAGSEGTTSPSTGPGADETDGAGCSDPQGAVEQIITNSCLGSGCHGSDAAGGLDLLEAGWEERLVGQPSSTCDGWIRVVPGDPASSFFFDKLGESAACGVPMPVGQPLGAQQLACVEAWISELDGVPCETCGGEACVDTQSDAAHCGGCDSPCPAGVACDEGSCACPEGTTACGEECVDVSANGEHCGRCDSPCDPGLLCNAGECAAGCGALEECGGGCVDTQTDSLHCGECDQPCPTGSTCTGGSCECPGPAVTYTQDIEPLFVSGCTSMGCHGFPVAQAGLDLREGVGYGAMVGVPSGQCGGLAMVEPGRPESSYLMNKLLGVDMCMGTRMPKGAAPYSGAELDLVSSWICQGAPE